MCRILDSDLNSGLTDHLLRDLQVELQELAAIEAASIGWLPLGDGADLHAGRSGDEEVIISVVGVPEVGMAGMNVLWVV